ncbi:cysteine--tRNA ligase [Candidatus Pacearchaeota archaeon CG06_land_8_20_14_3_00_35_12]|nr:MAG: cysteine--tRNA ligase [Candidatus Pacearchaeota archaeon CG06_land_8_20_14_3_00_35_12]
MLKLYNTLSRKKEVFEPIKDKQVNMYSCGPTIYDFAHIGNFRAYVTADLLKRFLNYSGFKVKQVMNLTDVDDKTIRRSQEEKISLKELTKKYEKAFIEDIQTLNIIMPEVIPKATEHIKEMVALVKKLLEKGYAYRTGDGIYFSISRFKNYGRLAGLNLKKLKQTARMRKDNYEKEEAKDFALWKLWQPEDGAVYWQTEIGKGRPGWHIECSAMSMKYLGEHFDIHSGGVDLIFPHHQNEIAQSEAATGKKFVNFWVHNEWLFVDGKKMSKSLGNFYTLRDIIKKGFEPLALRYLFLTAHYRSQLNFTFENLESSQNAYERLKNIASELKDDKKTNKEYLKEFEDAMNDDLDTPKALKVLWELVRDEKAEGKFQTIKKIDDVLGLDLFKKEKIEVSNEIKKLVQEREKARGSKDWKLADKIREKIAKKGYCINDTSKGPVLTKN